MKIGLVSEEVSVIAISIRPLETAGSPICAIGPAVPRHTSDPSLRLTAATVPREHAPPVYVETYTRVASALTRPRPIEVAGEYCQICAIFAGSTVRAT